MGLGVPGEVVRVTGRSVVIDCWGTQRVVRVESFSEALLPGDYVIEHDGVIVRRIPPNEVERTVELYETVLGEA